MIRGWLLLFCALAFLVPRASFYAQSRGSVDSLLLQLKPAQDSTRWATLHQLSLAYAPISADSAVFYGEKALSLATELDRDDLLFKSYNVIGVAHVRKRAYDHTLDYFLQALRLAETHTGSEWLKYQAQALINVAGVFWVQNKIERALQYAHRSRAILEQLEEPKVLADNYQSMGMMHRQAENFDSAQLYFDRAIDVYKQVGDKLKEGRTLGLIGELYADKGQYEEALRWYDESLKIAEYTQDVFIITERIHNIGKAYFQLGQYETAVQTLHKALTLCTSESFNPNRMVIYRTLADLYAKQNRYDSAYHYQQLYMPLREVSFDTERARQLDELELTYQTQKNTLENEMLRQQNQAIQKQNTYIIIIALLAIFGVLAIAVFYRRLQHKNEIITQQNQEVRELANELSVVNEKLSSLLEEKSHWISLITHDMQTPLSIIKFTTASMLHEPPDATAAKDLNSINSAAMQIGHLCERIIETQQLEDANLQLQIQKVSAQQVIDDAAKPYERWAQQKGVEIVKNAENRDFLVNTDPFLLSKAFGNILGNAVKFSKPGKTVYISLTTQNGTGKITIKDQGPGMTEEDRRKAFRKNQKLSAQPTYGEPGTGNGLYLAKRYIEAMNGSIALESSPGEGSTFTIELPLAK